MLSPSSPQTSIPFRLLRGCVSSTTEQPATDERMRLIATFVWNSIRHVCAHNAAVVCRKLVFAKYVFVNPLLSSVQRYTYTPIWSTISPDLNWLLTQPMNNMCMRTNNWSWWTYIIYCRLNFPRCGFGLDTIIQTSNRNSTATYWIIKDWIITSNTYWKFWGWIYHKQWGSLCQKIRSICIAD